MRAVMLMFDSLNRHMLSAYGCDWTHTPNFQRLAQRSVTFDRAYVGSMPCMPARRELHTGRPGLLHSNWGGMQPYDDSMVELLKQNGIHTHLASDHYHYWEEHACNYHTKYNTWEFFRGQEGDPWIGQKREPIVPENINKKGRPQDWINRAQIRHEQEWSLPQTVKAGSQYIRRNADQDGWFCQIECFDPHEPWFCPRKYRDLFEQLRTYDGPLFDWPGYCPVDEPSEAIEAARFGYAALLAMCDAYLGNMLDLFDELNLWDDTMLIVNTDHGFLLGEHNWWAKNTPPWYEELSHVPLFVHDPRHPDADGTRRNGFCQMIDMPAYLLEAFGLERPADMQGESIQPIIADDAPGRAAGLFGGFGHYVNVTDGQYVYMRAPDTSQPLNEYNLMPLNIRSRVQDGSLGPVELREPFSFTKGQPVLRIPCPPGRGSHAAELGHLLYDVANDPKQSKPIDNAALESRMTDLLVEQMRANDAPAEMYTRLGLASHFA